MRRLLNRIYWMCRTWYWRSRHIESMAKALNSRAAVEQALFDVANGKRGTLTPEECRNLAFKLGAPDRR